MESLEREIAVAAINAGKDSDFSRLLSTIAQTTGNDVKTVEATLNKLSQEQFILKQKASEAWNRGAGAATGSTQTWYAKGQLWEQWSS
jgi:hypothetical protein